MDRRLKKSLTLIAACALLSACGDPLANVDKLSSVELADDAELVSALPDATRTASSGGLFAGLFSRDPKPVPVEISQTDAAVSAALGLSDDVASDTTLTTASVELPKIEAASKPRGIFGFLRAKEATQSVVPVAALTAVAVDDIPLVETEKQIALTEAVPVVEPKPRRGLFGLLAGARANEKAEDDVPVVRNASLGAAIPPRQTQRKEPVSKKRNGRKHKGPDVQIVPFGTALPPGLVARVCDLPGGRLGKQVEKFPARGRGYKLIDSNPGSTKTRPFYVTGFDDNCARTFTAALALFGSPTMHEQLRYGLPSKVQPYSTTDKAYEGIKRSVCGVGRKKACGSKIKTLEKNTVFVSIYDRIGSNAQWSNILIHDGWVLASDRKG